MTILIIGNLKPMRKIDMQALKLLLFISQVQVLCR